MGNLLFYLFWWWDRTQHCVGKSGTDSHQLHRKVSGDSSHGKREFALQLHCIWTRHPTASSSKVRWRLRLTGRESSSVLRWRRCGKVGVEAWLKSLYAKVVHTRQGKENIPSRGKCTTLCLEKLGTFTSTILQYFAFVIVVCCLVYNKLSKYPSVSIKSFLFSRIFFKHDQFTSYLVFFSVKQKLRPIKITHLCFLTVL